MFESNGEPPLHYAVIDNDLHTVAALKKQKGFLNQVNRWGFTPVELAKLLGRNDALALMAPEKVKRLKYVPKDSNVAQSISPSELEKALHFHYIPTLQFNSLKTLTTALNFYPKGLQDAFYQGHDRKSILSKLWKGETADLCIKWVDGFTGYGLFTLADLNPGDFIGEYVGVIRRTSHWSPNTNPYCMHYPTRYFSWKFLLIDSMKKGNILRFMNHSDAPNCDLECVEERQLLHFVLLANQPIKRGTELRFNYGNDLDYIRTNQQ